MGHRNRIPFSEHRKNPTVHLNAEAGIAIEREREALREFR